MNKLKYLPLLLIAFFFLSCRKNGTGGKASINGQATYNGAGMPGVIVYIKFGTTQFPGSNFNLYDSQVSADANGNYTFGSILQGDYYLYAYDKSHTNPTTNYSEPLKGGTEARVTSSKQSVTYNIYLSK